jgi:hypothetical protein
MLRALAAFKARHGHCKVPAHCAENPQLGRWVAAQRYKRKIGDLSDAAVRQLGRLGFIWVPSDETWARMCRSLAAFKKKHRNCNVPEHWPKDQSLANWVQSQRYRKKKGNLSPDRVKELEEIGFSWSIYKCAEEEDDAILRKPSATDDDQAPAGERLYVIRHSLYVQYSGKGALPRELDRYKADHKGELPAYIPLPNRPTTFYLGESFVREKKVKWKAKGPLPVEILDHVKRNGTLPRYD